MEFEMIREIVKPDKPNLTIPIPEGYIGQEIEYIVFPLHPKHNTTNNIPSNLTDVDAVGGLLHRYADPARREQESSAWEQHIEEKYRL